MRKRKDLERKYVIDALRDLLYRGAEGTQDDIARELRKLGVEASQTSVSRALKYLSAEKHRSTEGKTVWKLPQNPGRSTLYLDAKGLIVKIVHNDTLVVIHTRPGAAAQVAYFIDQRRSAGVIGTIAGDDTVFVAAQSGAKISRVADELRKSLGG